MSFVLTIRTAEQRAAEARAQAIAGITARIDALVEARAREAGYNSAAHLAGYATSTVPDWAAEARAFVAWRDAVWLSAQAQLAAADARASLPDADSVLARLPSWRD